MLKGSCLCGGVRFEIAKAVGPFELCHCSRCRTSSGSAFAAFLGVEAADHRLLAGAELIFSGFGADPEVMRFLAWRPHAALADAEAAMERRLERLANGVEYSWILERLDSGAAVGLISGGLESHGRFERAIVRPNLGPDPRPSLYFSRER